MPNRTPKQQPAPHAAKDAKDVERMRLEHDLITDSGIRDEDRRGFEDAGVEVLIAE